VYNTEVSSKSAFYKKTQATLKSALKAMFPDEGILFRFPWYDMTFVEVLEEYKHPKIISASGRKLELDFFFPQLNLAFEHQVTCYL
jgi:hypothetical protein